MNQITNAPANGMDTRAQFNYNITDFTAALVTCTFHLDRKWRFSLFFIELALASFEFISINVIAVNFFFLRFVLVLHFQPTYCLFISAYGSIHFISLFMLASVGIHSNIPCFCSVNAIKIQANIGHNQYFAGQFELIEVDSWSLTHGYREKKSHSSNFLHLKLISMRNYAVF